MKINKIYLLLLVPLLMATQCDEDDDFIIEYETGYVIQNDSNIDLIFINEEAQEIVIESQSNFLLSSALDTENVAINPSDNNDLNSIELFKLDADDSLISTYQQDPIVDDLWTLSESSNFDFQYSLIITNDLLD